MLNSRCVTQNYKGLNTVNTTYYYYYYYYYYYNARCPRNHSIRTPAGD
jgi:hypothetical protein